MTAEDVSKIINEILVVEFELDPAALTSDATLQEDLDLDSLDAVDLIVALESRFGFRLQDKVVMEMTHLHHIHDHVFSLVQAAA